MFPLSVGLMPNSLLTVALWHAICCVFVLYVFGNDWTEFDGFKLAPPDRSFSILTSCNTNVTWNPARNYNCVCELSSHSLYMRVICRTRELLCFSGVFFIERESESIIYIYLFSWGSSIEKTESMSYPQLNEVRPRLALHFWYGVFTCTYNRTSYTWIKFRIRCHVNWAGLSLSQILSCTF